MFSDRFALRPQAVSTAEHYSLLFHMSSYFEPQNNANVRRMFVAAFCEINYRNLRVDLAIGSCSIDLGPTFNLRAQYVSYILPPFNRKRYI